MRLPHLSAYGKCSKTFIDTPTKRQVTKCLAKNHLGTKCPVHKSLATKHLAMKHPDQFDHLHNKCE
jgi:hypothetical protein